MISTKLRRYSTKNRELCVVSQKVQVQTVYIIIGTNIYRLKNIFLTNQFDLIYHNNVIDLNYNRKNIKYQKTNHHLEEVHQEHKA